MTERAPFPFPIYVKALFVLSLLVVILPSTVAPQDPQKSVSAEDKATGTSPKPLEAIEEEMRAKRAIKLADTQQRENLEKARDLSVLGETIAASFKQNNRLDREDLKKLEKVEKLAKSIRRAAGGSEDYIEMEKPPSDLASAMCMLGELSKSLKDKVEKTSKHVISAAVIADANVLLELIRVVRTLPPKV